MKNDGTVIPFNNLIKEMFVNRRNRSYLKAIHEYVIKYKKSYCLIHLYTLHSSLKGYYELLKEGV